MGNSQTMADLKARVERLESNIERLESNIVKLGSKIPSNMAILPTDTTPKLYPATDSDSGGFRYLVSIGATNYFNGGVTYTLEVVNVSSVTLTDIELSITMGLTQSKKRTISQIKPGSRGTTVVTFFTKEYPSFLIVEIRGGGVRYK
jgi:hypothetical protein